jgi:hypothetical protein
MTAVCPVRGRPRFFRITTFESDMRRFFPIPISGSGMGISYNKMHPTRIHFPVNLLYYEKTRSLICRNTKT